MFITSTAEGIMQLILLFGLWVAYLYFGWPSGVEDNIKHNPNGGGVVRGRRFIIVPISAFVTFYIAIVLLGSANGTPWQDTGAPFQALVITAGLVFTAMKLLPPTSYSAFWEVTDWDTGAFSVGSLQELTIEKGILWPIFISVHNTGTTSWGNYRVTINFVTEFEAKAEDDSFPSSHNWSWKTQKPIIMNVPCHVQVQRTNALVAGENQTVRFLVIAKTVGRFPITINVGVEGKPGDTERQLFLNVIDGVSKASQAVKKSDKEGSQI